MKASSPPPTPTPSRTTRRAPARRRAARSLAASAPALEGRALPSTLGLPDPGTPAAVVRHPGESPTPMVGLAGASSPVADGLAPAWPSAGPEPFSSPPGRSRDRIAMAEADIRVDGATTPEFAFADPARSLVLLQVGRDGPPTVLSAGDGIKNPRAVTLADVNGDGLPDLIVANSGNDEILVYPGLTGGGIGPEVGGGPGFAVGRRPAGVTIGDVNRDGVVDLIVANRGSDDVTLLLGQGGGSGWTMNRGVTLAAGAAPVRTALQDVNNDGNADLFILNSGSHDVTLYRGRGDGTFDTAEPTSFGVGRDPSELFVGRFDRRPGPDLVTVNSGSDDLTFIEGIATGSPRSMTFPSGGTMPEAAFAVDLNRDGVMDLVVANGGDGRLALLQGTGQGLRLAEVIARPDLPAPTAVAPAYVTESGLDVFAAVAGQDAAQLLHFDLGPASAFLAPPDPVDDPDPPESDLIAQLLPFGESDLELIAVLWEGGRGPRSTPPTHEGRGFSTSPIPDTEAPGPALGRNKPAGPSEPAPPVSPPPADPDSWVRFVLGLDRALDEPRGPVEAVAARDAAGALDGRDPGGPRRVDRPPVDPDLEAAAQAIDEALRSLRSEAPVPTPGTAPTPAEPGPGPATGRLKGSQSPAREPGTISSPMLASSLLFASRLILKASPPRPPQRFRRGETRPEGRTPRGSHHAIQDPAEERVGIPAFGAR